MGEGSSIPIHFIYHEFRKFGNNVSKSHQPALLSKTTLKLAKKGRKRERRRRRRREIGKMKERRREDTEKK